MSHADRRNAYARVIAPSAWLAGHIRSLHVGCLAAAILVAAVSGCVDDEPISAPPKRRVSLVLPPALDLPPWPGVFHRAPADDQSPEPNVVHVELEALESEIEVAEGRHVRMWTYNGQLPGPRIEARVGDVVRVHLKNSLPQSTTIHWHGLRVPADMDGAVVSRAPIEPGEEFTYEFVVREAGTFWYHPHIRGDEQVERGLYGAFVVRGDNEPKATTERVVVLDDLLLDEDWQLAPFDAVHAMIGRQGNLIIANGRAHPVVQVAAGGVHRFRFINTANARYFRLALPGYRLRQIGTDGGLLEAPQEVSEILLVPGQRADVLAQATTGAAEKVDLMTLAYDRGHGTGVLPDAVVSQIVQSDYDLSAERVEIPISFEPIPPLPQAQTERGLRFSEGLEGSKELDGESTEAPEDQEHETAAGVHVDTTGDLSMPEAEVAREIKFAINGRVYPDGVTLRAALGAVEDWSVVNPTEMDHPFHLHGFRFQMVAVDGVEPTFRAWRDTINIPAKTTVLFRVRLEDHPGTWMFHCHIQEHSERGMMGELVVEPGAP